VPGGWVGRLKRRDKKSLNEPMNTIEFIFINTKKKWGARENEEEKFGPGPPGDKSIGLTVYGRNSARGGERGGIGYTERGMFGSTREGRTESLKVKAGKEKGSKGAGRNHLSSGT